MEKTQGDFKYALRSDGTAEITAYGGTAGVLAIPAELDGHAVTVIGDGAFSWRYRLAKVVIPDGVTAIGDKAFSWCYGLIEITLPESLTTIGDEAFLGCSSLTSVIVDRDSFAKQYCIDNDLPHVTLPRQADEAIGLSFDRPRFCALCDLASALRYRSIDLPDGRTRDGTPESILRQFRNTVAADEAWARDDVILEEALWLKRLVYNPKSDPGKLPEALWWRGELLLSLLRELAPGRAAKLPVNPRVLLDDRELLLEAIRCVCSAMNGYFGNEYTLTPLMRTLLAAMPRDEAFCRAVLDALPGWAGARVDDPLNPESWPDEDDDPPWPRYKAYPPGDPRIRVGAIEAPRDADDPVLRAARQDGGQCLGYMPEIGELHAPDCHFALHPELLWKHPEACADWTLMCYLVSMRGSLLALATPELRDSEALVRVATQNDPSALRYASPRLRNKPELLRLARDARPKIAWYKSLERYWYHQALRGPDAAYDMDWDMDGAPPRAGETRLLTLMDGAFCLERDECFYALYGLSGPWHAPTNGVLLTRCRLLEDAGLRFIHRQICLTVMARVERVWTPEAWARDERLTRKMPWPCWQLHTAAIERASTHTNQGWPPGRMSVEGTHDVYDGCEEWYVYTDDDRTDHVLMTEKRSGDLSDFSIRYVGNLPLGDHVRRVRRNLIAEGETPDGRFRYGYQAGVFDDAIVHVTRYLADDVSELSFPSAWRLWYRMYPLRKKPDVVIHERAFESCQTLEKVTLPEEALYVEAFAFTDCPNLKRVSVPGSTRLAPGAFHRCGEGLTLAVRPGSPAHDDARSGGIAFELLPEPE